MVMMPMGVMMVMVVGMVMVMVAIALVVGVAVSPWQFSELNTPQSTHEQIQTDRNHHEP